MTVLYSAYLYMMNLRTGEMVFFRNLTKIDTDENKALYSNYRSRSNIVPVHHVFRCYAPF